MIGVSTLKAVAKKSTTLRIIMRNTMYFFKKIRYVKQGLFTKIDEKMVVFSAFNGRNYSCSPRAIYEYMISTEQFSDYHFVWLLDNPKKYDFLEKNPNTIVAKNGSMESEKYLHEAKYWIFNFRAYDHLMPKKEQIYVQCWHGTPLKRLGYDITNSDNAMNSIKEIREKYRTDAERFSYLLSPCKFVTDTFASAWDLKSQEKNNVILETGYPRNDYLSTFTEEDVLSVKKKLGLLDTDKKIILYAPTWRDNQYDAKKGYVYNNPVDFDYLQSELGDEYIVLFRAHYLVADHFDFAQYEGFIYDVSKYDDINDLYILADVLITDYSSVFFDYAILERPIIFYMYDMEEYRDEMRGFYLDINQLPGEILKTEQELVHAIHDIDYSAPVSEELKSFNIEYNLKNDGEATRRLVEKIFK